MKIGLVYEKFISRGGLENYLFSFATQLVADGHEVHVITRRTDAATSALDARIHRLASPALPSSLRMEKFSSDASRLVPELGLDVSIGFGRTVSHDLHRAGGGCHYLYSQLLNPAKRFGLKNLLELRLEKALYTSGKTRHFVVNSAQVGRQIREAYAVPEDRISVIHTAVDTGTFRPEADEDQRRRLRESLDPGLKAEDRIFLFVSRSHRRKGLDGLLNAWARLAGEGSGARLWILGAPLKARHRDYIRRLGLEAQIVAFPEGQEVRACYQAADFFVHPTLYDACANTVLESMACGLPGIISTRDGAVEFVEEGVTGYRLEDPEDSVQLSALLLQAASLGPDVRRGLGAAGRARVLPLTWRHHIDRWMEVIAAQLGSPGGL